MIKSEASSEIQRKKAYIHMHEIALDNVECAIQKWANLHRFISVPPKNDVDDKLEPVRRIELITFSFSLSKLSHKEKQNIRFACSQFFDVLNSK